MATRRPGHKDDSARMFCHSPETWKQVWEEVCGKEKVEVWSTLLEFDRRDGLFEDPEAKFYLLIWSVKRL